MVFAFGECELGPDLYQSALSTRVNAARRAIGESGSKQGYIRTVARGQGRRRRHGHASAPSRR
jgi:hypothetical protein